MLRLAGFLPHRMGYEDLRLDVFVRKAHCFTKSYFTSRSGQLNTWDLLFKTGAEVIIAELLPPPDPRSLGFVVIIDPGDEVQYEVMLKWRMKNEE